MKENGLKQRLGNGFAKFGREGSVWRWEFYWNEGKSGKQHGYDKGYLQQNADIFERLKTRFLNGVLVNACYYKKAYYFVLYLCAETNSKDIPVLELYVKSGYKLEHNFYVQAKEIFSQGTLNYISELINEAQVKIQSKEQSQNIKVSDLIQKANERFAKPQDMQARVQTFWEQLIRDCFPKDVRPRLATIKAKVDKQKKEFFLICTEEQKDFLEENISLWADYFLSKTRNYNVNYLLPKPTQEPMPVSINNQSKQV